MIRKIIRKIKGLAGGGKKSPKAVKAAESVATAAGASSVRGGKTEEWKPGAGESVPAERHARSPERRERSAQGSENRRERSAQGPENRRERSASGAENRRGRSGPPSESRPERRPSSGAAPSSESAPSRRRRPSPSGERPPREAAPTAPRAEPKPATPWDKSTNEVPPEEGKTRFQDLDFSDEILHAVADLGFRYCTPIQAQALPILLQGKDIAGRAQTGTGKTAAFLLAVFNHCLRHKQTEPNPPGTPRALVIAPTRELIMQIDRDAKALGRYLPLRTVAVYGGEDYTRQLRRIQEGPVDLVVATPGRLLDFRSRRDLHLGSVEIMVLDEADRMLDMGFIPDVRKIINSTPPKDKRQTLLFSATLSEPVLRLASSWMVDPVKVDIEPDQVAVDTVDQRVFIVTNSQKFPLMINLLQRETAERVLVFVNRRITAERLCRELRRYGMESLLISGALSQAQRTRALESFREGHTPILVATDVAGRGLHIDGVSHVVNFNIPIDPEDYVHRIGRTGRAGALGTSITFACEEESFYIPAIEKFIGRELPCIVPEDAWLKPPPRPHGVDLHEEEYTAPPSARSSSGSRGRPMGGSRGGRSGGSRPPPRGRSVRRG